MKGDLGLIEDIKKLIIARYPRFASQIAKTEFKYNSNLPYHTAGTDGKTIYIDPDYFAGLDLDNRIFLVAHELMHIKFEHKFRLKNRDGNMRDSHVWNIATDAIINANLERDGFVIPNGYINIKGALKYNSEELYDLLYQEKQRQQGNGFGGQGQKGQPQQEQEGSSQGGQENKPSDEKDKNGDKNKQGQSEGNGENSQEEKQGKDKQSKDKSNNSQDNSSENGKDDEHSKGNSQGKGNKNSQNEQNASGCDNSDGKENQDKITDSQNSSSNNQNKGVFQSGENASSGGRNENGQEGTIKSGQDKNQNSKNSPTSQDSIVKDFDFSQDTIDDHSLWEDSLNKNQERKQKGNKQDSNSSTQEQNNQDEQNSQKDKQEKKEKEDKKTQREKKASIKEKIIQKASKIVKKKNNNEKQDKQNDDDNLSDNQEKQDGKDEKNPPTIHEHDRNDAQNDRYKQRGEQDNSRAKNEFWKFDKDKFEQDSPDYEAKLDEREEFNKNRQERREITKQKFQQKQEQVKHTTPIKSSVFKDIGKTKAIIDWKLILRREVEKTETVWSQRRSIAENNYAYRLEENDLDEGVETEVLIDASTSVSDRMILSFVRQLKNIVKNSTLKVKFFAGVVTKDFIEIKTERDVDKMTIFRPYDGTNYDAAVRAFTNKRETNKIVFTDGTYGSMPEKDLKDANVLWLVYQNEYFSPCCGKVIFIQPQSIDMGQNLINEESQEEIERE